MQGHVVDVRTSAFFDQAPAMSVPLQIPQHDLDVLQDALSSVKLRISTRPYVHGRSACVGWSDVRQAKRIAKFTQLPEVVNVQRLANKLIAKFYPGFQWTSLMLNKDSVAAAHQDKNNVNFSVAIVIFPGSKHPLDGALFSTDHGVICPANHMNMFNGNEEHYNESYEGSPRWSIIAFHHKSWARSQQWHANFLLDLEYNLPKKDFQDFVQEQEGGHAALHGVLRQCGRAPDVPRGTGC